ncbi:CLUMA_CG002911, isoform A [Clunio marinus]|uniref:CLUMA_CG002911, isoform A n=1 Tax=Clunio marinus TaxID=568069 RepID=A0A1J1HRP7_9DIPT|nr:CLUMA_CG002911, isoform A [Clunio marinus]
MNKCRLTQTSQRPAGIFRNLFEQQANDIREFSAYVLQIDFCFTQTLITELKAEATIRKHLLFHWSKLSTQVCSHKFTRAATVSEDN